MSMKIDREKKLELNELYSWIDVLNEGHQNGLWKQIDDESLQLLSEIVIKIYSYKLEVLEEENKEPLMPLLEKNQLPETEMMIFINKLLEMKNIEIFELQLLKSFYR